MQSPNKPIWFEKEKTVEVIDLSEPADRSGPDEGVDGGESRVKVMLSVPT